MIRNEIDDFRTQFFDNVIQAEKEKEAERERKQKACYHLYDIIYPVNANGYQFRTCSKCEFTAYKKLTVWEGTKRCVVS